MFGPDILADRHADAAPGDDEHLAATARLEVAVFIEDIVGRQQRFECFADWLSALEQRGGVEERLTAAFVAIDVTDEQRHAANARVQVIDRLEILRNEARLEMRSCGG